MRIIAFINDAGSVKKILDQIGESTQPPRIAPARGPPLCEAAAEEQARNDPPWDWSAPERTGDRVRSAHRLVGPGRCQHKMRHDEPSLVRDDSCL